jgi:hypothetical protein
MSDRLWCYRELKHIVLNKGIAPEELAAELNQLFHNGENVRTEADVAKIRARKTILDR